MKLCKIFLVRLLLFLGQRTFIGRGKLRKGIIEFIRTILFLKKNNSSSYVIEDFVVSVLGVPFIFFLDKEIGYKFYFCRNERKEIFFIRNSTKENSVFIDIGANMGLYTQMIASNFKKINKSMIVAIEPLPLNCHRIKENLKLLENKIPNIFDRVKIEECAIGDFNKEIFLKISSGPANGIISNYFEKDAIKIKMKTLLNIIESNKITHITNLKIDVEGYEDKCLVPFFNSVNKKLYPENIVIEAGLKNAWGINIIDFLKSLDYKILNISKSNNFILSLK